MSRKEDQQSGRGGTDVAARRLIVMTRMAPGESFAAFKERVIAAFRAAGCLAESDRKQPRTSPDQRSD